MEALMVSHLQLYSPNVTPGSIIQTIARESFGHKEHKVVLLMFKSSVLYRRSTSLVSKWLPFGTVRAFRHRLPFSLQVVTHP